MAPVFRAGEDESLLTAPLRSRLGKMGDSPTDRRTVQRYPHWVLAVAVGLVGVAAYLPQCRYEFVYDDTYIITLNPVVCGGAWSDCFTQPYWPRELGTDPLYRPLTTLSLRLNYALFGDHALGYRAGNALIHGLCSALVAALAARFWRRRSAGWAAGLLFAAHPVHAEAVAMVVGRAELLAAVFTLAVLYRHIGHLDGQRKPSAGYHLTTAFLLLLGVACKEHAVVGLAGIACLDACWRRRPDGPVAIRERVNHLAVSHYLGLAAAVALFFLTRWLIFGGRTTLPPDQVDAFANPLIGASTTTALALPPALLFLSLRLMLVPLSLCPIWSVGGFELPLTFWRGDVLLGAALALATIIFVCVGLWRKSRVAVPVAWAGLFLILPCHFAPAANWLFAERWLYLPSAFALLLIAGLGRWRALLPVFVVGATAFLLANWSYQRCWRSTDDLMQAVVERHPYSYHGLIGRAYRMKLRDELAEAEPYIARLMERLPGSPRTWYYRALIMDMHDRPQEALGAITEFVRLNGPNPLPPALTEVRHRARRAQEVDEE